MKIAVVFALLAGLVSAIFQELAILPYNVTMLDDRIWNWNPSRRVHGGTPAEEGQFKFMVYVLVSGGFCSASLIKEDWVLLAAHCLKKVYSQDGILVIGGKAQLHEYMVEKFRDTKQFYEALKKKVDQKSLGVKEGLVEKYFIHPYYNKTYLTHDIALLKLKEPMEGENIEVIRMSSEKIKNTKRCTILGWGFKPEPGNPFMLHYVPEKLAGISPKYCKLKEKFYAICLQMKDSGVCQGDSGSPLVCDGKVWGVCSHGIKEFTYPFLCGRNSEDYYSELHPEIKWIEAVISGSGRIAPPLLQHSCFFLYFTQLIFI